MRKFFILNFILFINFLNAQVGINTTEPEAALDIRSSDSGILLPRFTNDSIINIKNPPEGLLFFNKDKARFQYWDGASWRYLAIQKDLQSYTNKPPEKVNLPIDEK